MVYPREVKTGKIGIGKEHVFPQEKIQIWERRGFDNYENCTAYRKKRGLYRLWNYGIFLWDFLTSLCETVDPPHIYIQYIVYFAFLFGCFEREGGGLVQGKSCKHMKRRESKKKMGLGFSFSLFLLCHFLTIIWKNNLNKHFLSCFDEKLQGKANEAMTIDSSKILRIYLPRVMNTVVGNSVSLQCIGTWDGISL